MCLYSLSLVSHCLILRHCTSWHDIFQWSSSIRHIKGSSVMNHDTYKLPHCTFWYDIQAWRRLLTSNNKLATLGDGYAHFFGLFLSFTNTHKQQLIGTYIEKALKGLQVFEIDLRCHASVHKERRKISQPCKSLIVKLCTKLKALYLTVLSPFLRDAFKC